MHRHEVIVVNVVGLGLALSLLAGCAAQSRQKLLSVFVDRDQPPPPTRRLRRDLLQEIEGLKQALADAQAATSARSREAAPATEATPPLSPPGEHATDWRHATALLPADSAGHIDWDQALASGAIRPRPSPDPAGPMQAVFDLDAELTTSGRTFGVSFSHAGHTRWLACQSCHPAPFPLTRQAAPTAVTMRAIRQGRLCGACHGTVAFDVKEACARCHTAIPARAEWRPSKPPAAFIETLHRWEEAKRLLPAADGAPEWTAALVRGVIAPRPAVDSKVTDEPILASDVVRVPAGMEDYKVVFPHAAHTAWMNCESCHPDPFHMKAGATPMSMDRINAGELCGRCHGTVAFPASACSRCHPAMEAGP